MLLVSEEGRQWKIVLTSATVASKSSHHNRVLAILRAVNLRSRKMVDKGIRLMKVPLS